MYIKVDNLVLAQGAAQVEGIPVDFIGKVVSIDGENVVVRAYDGEEWPSTLSNLKQVVHYDRSQSYYIQKGERASVVAIDHPNPSIFKNEFVSTSVVEEVDNLTGFFETRNTLYMSNYVLGEKSPYLP